MFLPDTLNSPRLCKAGGKYFWVRRMSLEAYGIVLAWLDDVLPGQVERKGYPAISDEASQKALQSWPGAVLLTWLALRDSGVTYEECAETYAFRMELANLEDEDVARAFYEHLHLLNCLFNRRRTMEKSEGDSGEDIGQTWCAKGMASLAAEYGLENVAKLSLDQYEWLVTSGEVDEGNQYDLAAIQADLPRRIALIEAAMKDGSIEEIKPSNQ